MQYVAATDTHNKHRQHHLALEKCWPTKDCWFRLFTAHVGFACIDLLFLYRNEHKLDTNNEYREMSIKTFADLICSDLEERKRTPTMAMRKEANKGVLKRIADEDGNITKRVTKKQRNGKHHRHHVGSAIQGTCWICRMYRKDYKHTSFCCVKCGTPLCQPSEKHPKLDTDPDFEFKSCTDHHNNSCHHAILCDGHKKRNLSKAMKTELGLN